MKHLLVYPQLENLPKEIKPIHLPGGHYKKEQIKRHTKKATNKVTNQDKGIMEFLPAAEEDSMEMSLIRKSEQSSYR